MRINPDNTFVRVMTAIFDVTVTFFLFVLCCVPVVTVGAASTALHTTMLSVVNDTCGGVLRKFFGSFKDNFKIASVLWLIFALVGAVVVADVIICFGFDMAVENSMLYMMRGITLFCVALYTLMGVFTFAGVAKFKVTWKQALRNGLIFLSKFPLASLGILILNAAILICLYLGLIWAIPVVIILIYLQELILNGVFNKTLGIKKEKRSSKKEETLYYE